MHGKMLNVLFDTSNVGEIQLKCFRREPILLVRPGDRCPDLFKRPAEPANRRKEASYLNVRTILFFHYALYEY